MSYVKATVRTKSTLQSYSKNGLIDMLQSLTDNYNAIIDIINRPADSYDHYVVMDINWNDEPVGYDSDVLETAEVSDYVSEAITEGMWENKGLFALVPIKININVEFAKAA